MLREKDVHYIISVEFQAQGKIGRVLQDLKLALAQTLLLLNMEEFGIGQYIVFGTKYII